MSWKYEVEKIVCKICPVEESFSLEDIYVYGDYFKQLYPNNNHIEDKIRQVLQVLRDEGMLEFIDNNGRYYRLR